MMKAMVCTQYGSPDVLQLQEVEKPVPTSNEVLIKVHAATATTASVVGRTGKPNHSKPFTIKLNVMLRQRFGKS